jgi:hypothetical protein
MSLRWRESPGKAARIAALSTNQWPTAINEPVVSVQNRRWGALDDTHDEDFLSRGQVKSYGGISAIELGFGNARVNRKRTLETGLWTWTSSRNHWLRMGHKPSKGNR